MVDITVITPSLGYGRFIEDAILSVKRQEGISIQHIVQDGGSTDDTLDVLRRYEGIVDWRSEPDAGQSDALNKALSRAAGRWIAWLNADEFYLPGGLRALIELGEESAADVVYGDNVWVDEEGRMLRLVPQHPFSSLILRLYGCFIPSSSALFRRSALMERPWDTEARMMMDWELYLKLDSLGAKFRHLRYPVGAFRRHQAQVTATPSSQFRDEYLRIFSRYGTKESQRRWGRWLHGAYKGFAGGYRRQSRAQQLQGECMRWFMDGSSATGELLRRSYGVQLGPTKSS